MSAIDRLRVLLEAGASWHDEEVVSAYGQAAFKYEQMRAALEAVEWHTEEDDWQVCAWCHAGGWGNQKHEPNCQRQEALKEEG